MRTNVEINVAFDLKYVLILKFNFKKFLAALVIALTGISCSQASEFAAGPTLLASKWGDRSDASGVINVESHAGASPA